jgi:hypothetical protein
MFVWFVFRDSAGNPWQSGLEVASGAHKPAYNTFGALARLTDGQTFTATAGRAPRITIYVPYLSYYSATGTPIGLSYSVQDGAKLVNRAISNAPLGADQSVSFTPVFTPVKGHTYTVTTAANEPNGHTQTRITLVKVS